ncbi:MAG: hypothetical protein Kilf2KO_35450 [Rhodospirillales bacterium]
MAGSGAMSQPDLPRRRPQGPIEVHPVPEYLADPALAARYGEMKQAFGVPWMGVVAMAHAHYRRFYDQLWSGLRALAGSSHFQESCRALRAETERAAAAMDMAPLGDELDRLGYAPREVAEIRATLEVFSIGNYPYLLLASLSRHLLRGGTLVGEAGQLAPAVAATPQAPAKLVLMEAHHADPGTRALYLRIQERLDLPFVNTDYRALARWPSYFQAAWARLEPEIRTPQHLAACEALHEAALKVVRHLPAQPGLEADRVIAAAEADASLSEVLAMVELFQWLLPELCLNVALLRAQLD